MLPENVVVKPNTYLYLAILLLFVPMPWMCAWLVAVMFHELCHWVSVLLLGGRIYRIMIEIGGIKMEADSLSDNKRLIGILCGPIGGFGLVFMSRWFPRVALCSLILSTYNLMPVLPLDGGHALKIIFRNRSGFYIAEKIILILITIIILHLSISYHLGVLPMAIVLGLWVRNRNSPCKENVYKVQ